MESFDFMSNQLILGNVYTLIGESSDSNDLLDILEIDVVISILSEYEYDRYQIIKVKNKYTQKEWHHFPINDDEDETISTLFHTIHEMIEKAIQENKKVFIHCAGGRSRSVSFVIAYLMIKNGWSFDMAYDYVKQRRYGMEPNQGFVKQLTELKGKN
jgi:protein-tyrosine phosphatase